MNYSQFSQFQYDKYCQYLSDRDGVSLKYFKGTELGTRFWIDVRGCFNGESLNTSHMLEIFGKYCDQEPNMLQQRILDIVEQDKDVWESVGRVVLSMKFTIMEDWIDDMRDTNCQCDEFMLYVLSRVHCCHTRVYTLKCPWSTVDSELMLTVNKLHSACDIHLVYLGSHIYGELHLLPMSTFP